ncbi:hypothetical protein, partial [Streptomyces sp. NPDC000133]|uniref:hypothetical protein n=1 Tax=Streptomyces sp. NPDC000133 TaxID=3364535 RepID=UPI003689867D
STTHGPNPPTPAPKPSASNDPDLQTRKATALRLDLLLHVLDNHDQSPEETCDRLLETLRDPHDHDDVSVLIARPRPQP